MAQPNFTRVDASIQGPNLCVTSKEVGTGNKQLITYILSANAIAEYACVDRGGQFLQASNKETVSGSVSTTATFESGNNGQVTATICVSPPPPGNFSCPPGQQLVLVSVTYNTVTLTDVTNQVRIGLSGTFSETFVNFVKFGSSCIMNVSQYKKC